MTEYLTPTEGAREVSSADYLRRLCREGKIGAVKVAGRYWVIPREAIEGLKSSGKKADGQANG